MCACSENPRRPAPFSGSGWRRALAEAFCLLALAGLLAVAAAQWHPRRAEVAAARDTGERVSVAAALELARLSPSLWIDARPAAEFERGHAPEALRLTEAEWDDLLDAVMETWSPEQTIFVYCGSAECGASAGVAARLRRDLGAENVRVIEGGWEALSR